MNNNSPEINIILNNIKKHYLVFILFNILILIGFFLFYYKTYEIKNEKVNIKFITSEFPLITNFNINFYHFINFKTDYEYATDNSSISSNWPNVIDLDELHNEINIYFDQYNVQLYSFLDKANTISNIYFTPLLTLFMLAFSL